MNREKGRSGKKPRIGSQTESSSVQSATDRLDIDAADDIQLESISSTDPESESAAIAPSELRGEWLDGFPTDALESQFLDDASLDPFEPADPVFGDFRGLGVPGGGGYGIRQIIDNDDRVRILDTSELPYRWICHLEIVTANGSTVAGTGWLIGPRTVLTAGHCVWDKDRGDAFSRSIVVRPGRNGSRIGPESRHKVLHTVKQWAHASAQDRRFDYGAITLDKPLGDEVGFFGFANLSSSELTGMKLNIVGYPGDKPRATMWGHAQAARRVKDQLIEYQIDTFGGQSGSPVFVREGNDFTGVGVHNSGSRAARANFATRINRSVFDQIMDWRSR